jgi:hypothetical protein
LDAEVLIDKANVSTVFFHSDIDAIPIQVLSKIAILGRVVQYISNNQRYICSEEGLKHTVELGLT